MSPAEEEEDGGGEEEPGDLTQHWMLESPGQAPAMKVPPEQLLDVERQVPEPEDVLQVWVMQHWLEAAAGQ